MSCCGAPRALTISTPVPPAAEPARRGVYLHPGQVIVSVEPCAITTVLGSCVAVCLWDPRLRLGGMNHFLLPQGHADARSGGPATDRLVAELRELGAGTLVAKLFGGACVLAALRNHGKDLGMQNVAAARQTLERHGIAVLAADTGGQRARRLVFHTDEGFALVRRL